MDATPIRVLLYSHDSQGLGHVRRNLAIAHHLARVIPAETGREVSGLLVSGLPRASRFPLPKGFDWLTIPGISKGEDGYEPRNLGAATKDLINLRSSVLEAALLGFMPDLVIIDRHIYGVRKELRRPLRRLRAAKPEARVVLGLREVLDEPEVVAAEWKRLKNPTKLRELVDEVWIYGDRNVHDPIATGEAPPALVDRIRFTGYLANGRADAVAEDGLVENPPFILTTTGGGSDGMELLRVAVAIEVPEGYQHLVVTGPQLDDDAVAEIQAQAGPKTIVYQSLPGLVEHIENAAAVIAMGGYNTVCEILATDTPGLIVPREVPRLEQLIRAEAMQRVGAMDLMRADDVTSASLSAWVADAVERRADRSHIERDGLTVTAHYAAELLTRHLVGASA
ncbi:MAG TPA: glycosyl transferase family 28 [Tessaracoccus flavescens]|uniref:Glycosyl transferase family 28 n=1 Tax=Tessaracoccus flavescens TaxID=399497 RepID=A0A921EPP3_9ACTN|nr:glycosyl transferase family 28 [Tessaracoccus flavescens]